jgi:L-2-hydroxyglutarate oxidase LhgO
MRKRFIAESCSSQQRVEPRGAYYESVSEKRYLVKNSAYPVPNPDFPFLGVHYSEQTGIR